MIGEATVGKIDDANRKLAVRAVHASLGERARMPLTEYAELLASWEVIPIIDKSEVIGAVMRQGHEVHIGMTRTPTNIRWLVWEALEKTIAFHGKVTTSVMDDNAAGLAFCKRLGFQPVELHDGAWHLICTQPTYTSGRSRALRRKAPP